MDYQLDYMERLFFSIKFKKTESYVIHRIWNKLDDARIQFKVQQKIMFPNGKYALADLYLPQLNIFVEINKPFHEAQKKEDEYRNATIVNLTHCDQYIIRCGNSENSGEWKSLEDIHQQIDECIAFIKERIAKTQEIKDMRKCLTVEYHKEKGILKVEDQDSLRTIDDICAVFNTEPKRLGFLRVGAAPISGNDNMEIWYPNVNNKHGWKNELYDDGETFAEYNEDIVKRKKHVAKYVKDNKQRATFFRYKDVLGIELYRFVGVFSLDVEVSKEEDKCIWRRISTEYKL